MHPREVIKQLAKVEDGGCAWLPIDVTFDRDVCEKEFRSLVIGLLTIRKPTKVVLNQWPNCLYDSLPLDALWYLMPALYDAKTPRIYFDLRGQSKEYVDSVYRKLGHCLRRSANTPFFICLTSFDDPRINQAFFAKFLDYRIRYHANRSCVTFPVAFFTTTRASDFLDYYESLLKRYQPASVTLCSFKFETPLSYRTVVRLMRHFQENRVGIIELQLARMPEEGVRKLYDLVAEAAVFLTYKPVIACQCEYPEWKDKFANLHKTFIRKPLPARRQRSSGLLATHFAPLELLPDTSIVNSNVVLNIKRPASRRK